MTLTMGDLVEVRPRASRETLAATQPPALLFIEEMRSTHRVRLVVEGDLERSLLIAIYAVLQHEDETHFVGVLPGGAVDFRIVASPRGLDLSGAIGQTPSTVGRVRPYLEVLKALHEGRSAHLVAGDDLRAVLDPPRSPLSPVTQALLDLAEVETALGEGIPLPHGLFESEVERLHVASKLLRGEGVAVPLRPLLVPLLMIDDLHTGDGLLTVTVPTNLQITADGRAWTLGPLELVLDLASMTFLDDTVRFDAADEDSSATLTASPVSRVVPGSAAESRGRTTVDDAWPTVPSASLLTARARLSRPGR